MVKVDILPVLRLFFEHNPMDVDDYPRSSIKQWLTTKLLNKNTVTPLEFLGIAETDYYVAVELICDCFCTIGISNYQHQEQTVYGGYAYGD